MPLTICDNMVPFMFPCLKRPGEKITVKRTSKHMRSRTFTQIVVRLGSRLSQYIYLCLIRLMHLYQHVHTYINFPHFVYFSLYFTMVSTVHERSGNELVQRSDEILREIVVEIPHSQTSNALACQEQALRAYSRRTECFDFQSFWSYIRSFKQYLSRL